MLTTIVITMVIYFALMIGISWMGKKHATNFEDYLNAGRSATFLMLIGASIGAQVGNGLVVGGGAEGASIGLSGIAYGVGCCIAYFIIALILTDFVWKRNLQSLADYLRERYKSEAPAQIYNFATIFSYIGLMAGQLMAGGALFEALGLSKLLGIIVIACVVFLYSQISGLWGSMATSVIQSGVMLVGLIGAGVYLLSNGAWSEIQQAVANGTVPSTFTSPFRGYAPTVLVGLLVPTSLQILTDESSYLRIVSAKTAPIAKWGHVVAALLMIPVCILPTIIGMVGRVRFGAVGNEAFFTVILNVLPPVFSAMVVTAIIAAVMSTLDIMFVGLSQVVLNDFYKLHINKNATSEQLSKMTLGLNVIICVVCIVFAATASSLVGMMANCYLFLEGACLVPFLGGRWYKGATKQGAIAASIVGTGIAVLEMLGIFSLPYSGITLFIPSLIVFIVVSMITSKGKSAAQ